MRLHTGFLFRCYNPFKKKLGELDAVVEFNEIALRELVCQVENADEPSKYLSHLSTEHLIRVNALNTGFAKTRVSYLYLICVYQQFEKFLEDFRDEHPSKEWGKLKGETLLTSILRNLDDTSHLSRNTIDAYKIETCDYYRMIRNYFLHSDKSEENLDTQLKELKAFSTEIVEQYKISKAPNKYDEVTFDDFLLFSRAAKDLAAELCRFGKPDTAEIVQMIFELDGKTDSGVRLSNLSGLRNNELRLSKKAFNLVRTLYNLDGEEAKPVVEELLKQLYEQWGR